MKRREFIVGATSTAGIALLDRAYGAVPCPPEFDGVGSGSPCPTVDAEADWQARINGSGVVWYHDFRSDSEVGNYRWAPGHGNDPNDVAQPGQCIRNTSDGITGGGCLELIYPIGNTAAPGWWRPFSPMSGISNGRGEDDPAANSSIELAPWDPGNRSENGQFREGYYAHPSIIGADGFGADLFHGSEFWLQFRIKVSSNRYLAEPNGGKLSFLATTQQTLNQEIVQQNKKTALWYTNFGSSPDTGGSLGVNNGTKQPGGDYSDCGEGGSCWEYEGDEWVTMLYHLIPGTDGNKDTLFEVFAARPGQSDYETIFSQLNTINFSSTSTGHPKGYNSFQPSNYMNNQSTTIEWFHRYDQIIFSHNFIACPQV